MVMTFMRKLARVAPVARLRALVSDFRRNRRGNVAVITALATLPMIAAVGCVIDYSTASMIKTKLQAAADAATVASVSINSSVTTTAKAMSGNGAVTGGSTFLTAFFNSNLSAAPESTGYTSLTPTGSVTKAGQTITATLSFTAQVPTYFMGVMGYKNISVAGSSTASYSLPAYIDFYLMLDVSGSMSFPSTSAEQQRLMAVNPDNLNGTNGYPNGCQFACHFAAQGTCAQSAPSNPYQGPIPAVGTTRNPGTNPSPGGYCQGFIISRLGTTPTSFASGTNPNNGNSVNWNNLAVSSCPNPGTTSCIQLRADAVGYAVTALLGQASTTETKDGITNQFRVGLFPFIVNLCTSSAGSSNSCSVGLTSSLTGSTITNFADDLANLLDTGQNATLGSGGTHFENALSSMNSFISTVGTGASSSNTLPYVFLITDGSQDYQTQSSGSWGAENWSSTANVPYQNSATVLPTISPNDQSGGANGTNYCTTMKNRGITVAVLYIPYQQILDPNKNFANNEDGYANTNVLNNYYSNALQACASPNFFYTASTPAAITTALGLMFEQAASMAHITN
jgi:Flp pilus assembly protein TadG